MNSQNKLDLTSIQYDKPLQKIFHHLNGHRTPSVLEDHHDILFSLLHGLNSSQLNEKVQASENTSPNLRQSLEGALDSNQRKSETRSPVVIYQKR